MEKSQIAQIVENVKNGDKSAFEKLYAEFNNSLTFFVGQNICNKSYVDDIVQQAFLDALDKIQDLKNNEAFKKWLYTIAHNLCINYNKSQKGAVTLRDENDEEADIDEIFSTNDELSLPSNYLDDVQMKMYVRNSIDDLTDNQRSALILFYYEQMSVTEISNVLDTNENTVKSRLSSAREALKKKFSELKAKGIELSAVPITSIIREIADASEITPGGAVATGSVVAKVVTTVSLGAMMIGIPIGLHMYMGNHWGGDVQINNRNNSSAVVTVTTSRQDNIIEETSSLSEMENNADGSDDPVVTTGRIFENTLANREEDIPQAQQTVRGGATTSHTTSHTTNKTTSKNVISTTMEPIIIDPTEPVEIVGYGSENGLDYTAYSNGTVKITKYTGNETDCTIPQVLDGKLVYSIGTYAFYNCKNLNSITIPYGVTYLEDNAFAGCTNLAEISLPDSLVSVGRFALSSCSNLKEIVIPKSVKEIDDYAFFNCTTIPSVNIPYGVTSIGRYAFYKCSNLSDVNMPDSINTIGKYAFAECTSLETINIPGSVTLMEHEIFSGCTSLSTINLLYGIQKIDDSAFAYCSELSKVSIPDSVTTIGNSAFSGCKSLTSISIPESVTTIEDYAFSKCRGLESISLPDSLSLIKYSAFSDCIGLKSIDLPDSLTLIDNYAFKGCSGLNSIFVPENVTKIGILAFSGCTELTSVSLPDNLAYIGGSVFKDCTNLTDISFSKNLKIISSSFFYNCPNIKSFEISDKIEYIGINCFCNCTGLKSITIPKSVNSVLRNSIGYNYSEELGYRKVEGFKIYCYRGTEGEKYAVDNGFDYELLD